MRSIALAFFVCLTWSANLPAQTSFYEGKSVRRRRQRNLIPEKTPLSRIAHLVVSERGNGTVKERHLQ